MSGPEPQNEPQDEQTDAPPEAAAEEAEGLEEAEGGEAAVMLSYAEYEELKTLARERDDYLKRLQRAMADYQNLQKRIDRQQEMARQATLRSLAEGILPVADSLERALEAARQTEGGGEIVKGLELVAREFYGALARFEIEPIEAVGRAFDPHFHDALMQEPTDVVEPNTVLRELKKGFAMGEAVIRPSQVIVAAPPAQGSEAPEDRHSGV